ncbi:hypothetical protein ACIGD1_18740 [Streptomyces sp. NPDC085612]|uniref:hypothetical protein n=1 Tax=Streptomyces sp. NPDC085612 TaxID=3365732 RepID=UPI0037D1787B
MPRTAPAAKETSIAVTGHANLTGVSKPLIREALESRLLRYPVSELTGVSCLAAGADRVFAEAVLAVEGRLVAVIPSWDYRERMVDPGHTDDFDRLCRAAAEIKVMPYRRTTREAYAAANRALLGRAELLMAVWDGMQGGRGGTADVVATAQAYGLPVEIVWPAGAARETHNTSRWEGRAQGRPS